MVLVSCGSTCTSDVRVRYSLLLVGVRWAAMPDFSGCKGEENSTDPSNRLHVLVGRWRKMGAG